MKNLLTLVSFLLISYTLGATTYTFTAASGDWDNSANWDNYPGGVISGGDEVIIDGICTIPNDLSVMNQGTITINEDAELITTSGGPIFINQTNGTLVINGKLITNNNVYNQGTTTNNGELESNHVYINFATFINNGKVTFQGNQFSNTGTFTNNDEIIALTTMSNQEEFNQLGIYRGTDDFNLDAFTNEGTMAPGAEENTIGKLTFNTDYIEEGTYEVNIAGSAGAGVTGGHDFLDLNASTTISGTLDIKLIDGYIPEIGESFTILVSTNTISGTYGTVLYSNLPLGRSWEVEYNSTNIKVKVIAGNSSPNTKTYYVSNSSGDDSNDGLSPSTPWQSIAKIASISYETGDSIFLKRDDTWSGISQYFSRSFVYIGSYGTGSLPKITNIQELPNVNITANWTLVNGLWECVLLDATTRLFLDDVEVLRGSLLTEVGVVDSEGYTPKWFHTNGKIYIDHPSNPALTWSSIKGSQNYITFNMENSNAVTINEVAFEGGTGPSLQLAGANNIKIQNCELGKFGSSGILLVNGSNNCTINNNLIDSEYTEMYGIGNATDRGCRDGIRLANDASYNIIENNTLKNWSHYAIELLNTYSTSDGVNQNTIRYNTISAPDIPYAHPIGTDGPSGRCNGNDIGYNYITDCRTTCQINGENNRFHHNILKHFRQSPAKNTFSAHVITVAAYDVLGIGNISRNNVFENNLIVDSDESAFRFDDQGFDILVDSIFIRNNIIIDSGLDPINGEYNTGTAIYFDDSEYMNNIFFQNNLFFQNSVVGDVLYKVISDEYINVSDLNLLEELDGITAFSNIKSDPELDVNDAPIDESIAVNNGRNMETLLVGVDYFNNTRINDGTVDIGPIENQNICNNRSIIFVDSLAQGGQTGRTWRNAFLTITDALDGCPDLDEKTFWVAKGHYYPTDGTDQTIAFTLEDGSQLFGGFDGKEILLSERNIAEHKTILSGDIGTQDVASDNSDVIILQNSETGILYDGIYIEDAQSSLDRSAIDLGNSDTKFANSTIQNNESNQYAAIDCDGCIVNLDNIEIINNTTISPGIISISTTGFIEINNSIIEGEIKVLGVLETTGNSIFRE